MARAKGNPTGGTYPGVEVVRVGNGERTHILGTHGVHLCRSGINVGAPGSRSKPLISPSYGKFVSCYRCNKLASINQRASRRADEPGD